MDFPGTIAPQKAAEEKAERLQRIAEEVEAHGAVQFLTNFPDFRIVVEPGRHPYRMADGSQMPGSNGVHVEFDGIRHAETRPEIIDYLRNHERFNLDFWEFGRAPGEAQPTVQDQMTAITSASVERDAVALQELIDSERSTHNRALIIETATNALRSIAGGPQGG